MNESIEVKIPGVCDRLVNILDSYRSLWQDLTRYVDIVGKDFINFEGLLRCPTLARPILTQGLVTKKGININELPISLINRINDNLYDISDDELTIILIAAIINSDRT